MRKIKRAIRRILQAVVHIFFGLLSDIPAGEVAVGNPAKVLGEK